MSILVETEAEQVSEGVFLLAPVSGRGRAKKAIGVAGEMNGSD